MRIADLTRYLLVIWMSMRSVRRWCTAADGWRSRQQIARRSRSRASYFGFHSRASFCASAICAGVIFAAALARFLVASALP